MYSIAEIGWLWKHKANGFCKEAAAKTARQTVSAVFLLLLCYAHRLNKYFFPQYPKHENDCPTLCWSIIFAALDIYVFYVYTGNGKQKEVSAYMPMTPKQIIKLLEQNGFVYVSANGSHAKYHNPTTGKTTIVPVHAKDLKVGTEKNILKQAGINK